MTPIESENATDKIQQLLLALGKAYLERQQYSQAFERFQQLLEMGCENAEVTFGAAQAAISLQDVSDSALQLYEKAATHNPTSRNLKQMLAELFLQFDVATPFALEIINDLTQPAQDEAKETEGSSPPAIASINNEHLEALWWQGHFDEALNLLQLAGDNNGHDALAIELALTYAYQAIAKNETIGGDKTANLILNGLEMLSPAGSLRDLRNYLTLRLALPELIHENANGLDDSDEYKFILGLVSMEDFFCELKNGSAKESFILNKFDLKKEILDTLKRASDDYESDCLNSWQSILIAETQDGKAFPKELITLISSSATELRDCCLRFTGGGFIILARDPLQQTQWAAQLLKKLIIFNRSYHDSYRVNLNCGLVASKKQDAAFLKDLVTAIHLPRMAGGQKSAVSSPSHLFVISNEEITDKLCDTDLSVAAIHDALILPGHSATCYEVCWFNPFDFLDDGHPGKLAEFLVEKPLAAQSGYSTFLGLDRRLGRRLLFKVISNKALPYVNESDKKLRLLETLRTIGRLSHPNIATLFDIGEQDRMIYFIREYVEGKPITEMDFADDNIENEMVTLMLKLVRALAYAQKQGIHHLNLKPPNIWVNEAGVLKVTDFFCAEFSTRDNKAASAKYVAPEVLAAESGDERSDIFSIGIIVEELLAHRVSDFDQLRPHWQEILDKATHNDPSYRFQTLSELETELRGIQIKLMDPQPTTADA